MNEVHIIFECYDTGAECRRWPIEIAYSTVDAAEDAYLKLSENETEDKWWEIFTFPLRD